jgi:two-component system, chemotaxis family, sensor histidine kinase and response regulator PixL
MSKVLASISDMHSTPRWHQPPTVNRSRIPSGQLSTPSNEETPGSQRTSEWGSEEAPTKPRTRQALSRHPVLIVDDYADSRATLREMVEDVGLDVVEAADGQEAFNFLVFNPQVHVQLILLDLDMPRMNGFDFLTLLKSYLRLSAIPVVVVSRQADQLPTNQRIAINGAFQAPYEMSSLRAIVEALVSH